METLPSCEVTMLFLLLTSQMSFGGILRKSSQKMDDAPSDISGESTNDEALFLTPLIEQGEIKKAQKAATVRPMLKNVYSFSGYLTVNSTTFSNLFFWFFKSQLKDWESRPIVVWLQGGPGSSSMYGLFVENGPFWVDKEYKLRKRKYSWNRKCNLVFFDNPIGTGFSFTNKEAGYANDENDVARDLYAGIIQLLKLFPALQKNEVFITGESYGGKYVPAIAYKIYKENPTATLKVNLSGIFIGNGLTDPLNQIEYGNRLYYLGLVDDATRIALIDEEDKIRAFIRAGNFPEAGRRRSAELERVLNITGFRAVYDFIHDDVGQDGPELTFINDPRTKKAIHVGDHKFDNAGEEVYEHLQKDIMKSLRPWVEELLSSEAFPVLYYSGQLDLIDPYPLSLGFFNSLQWPYAYQYKFAQRCQFKVGTDVAGYYKTAGTFTEVLVRNTGHMAPIFQPEWVFELLDRFITNSSSFLCS